MTGIYPDDLVSGATPETVWGQLLQQGLGWRGSSAAAAAFPTTIHFSRFEEPFLRHLHKLLNPGKPFPLGIICTHEIIRRLLPWLPRRGMRAAAGYFGYSTPEKRRCAPHVTATAAIWANCVMLLEKDHGVESLADLDRWLRTTDIPPRTDRKFPLAGSDRLLPEGPGIYRMRRANGDLLYIGKAARLRQRVSSYFHKRRRHPEHILEMLTQARDLTATETASALEAAILESDEIKSRDPPYNRSLKVGDRRLVFCARDFSRQAGLPDQAHPLGPLPKVQDAAALQEAAALVTIRAGGRLDPAVADKLSISGIFRGGRPNADVLSRGLDVFWESHCSAFARGRSPARALPGIGARLWRVRLKAAEQEGDKNRVEEHTQEAGDVQAQPDWTPETVSTALEGLICRKMHLLRRARWLCLLSEIGPFVG